MKGNHQFRIRDASQDRQPEIQSSPVREDVQKNCWSRPTTTADFRSSFWQRIRVSNVRLLEDKIRDWGMYLFTISYGSHAVGQRSGVGLFSGWSRIFVSCDGEFECQILKYSMRGLLQHWTKSSIIPSSKGESVWRNKKGPERGPFPSRQTDCLLDLRSLPGHWDPWFCRKLHRPVHYCSSKWRYSGIRF